MWSLPDSAWVRVLSPYHKLEPGIISLPEKPCLPLRNGPLINRCRSCNITRSKSPPPPPEVNWTCSALLPKQACLPKVHVSICELPRTLIVPTPKADNENEHVPLEALLSQKHEVHLGCPHRQEVARYM